MLRTLTLCGAVTFGAVSAISLVGMIFAKLAILSAVVLAIIKVSIVVGFSWSLPVWLFAGGVGSILVFLMAAVLTAVFVDLTGAK